MLYDNKTIWRNVKPLFSDKRITNDNIILVDNNLNISKGDIVAETFNAYFVNMVKNMNIIIDPKLAVNINVNDRLYQAIERYTNHPSIVKIKELHGKIPKFTFKCTTMNEMRKEISGINISKSSPMYSIAPKIIKENSKLFTPLFNNNFNNCISTGKFPCNLKLADITPGHKNGERQCKTNDRPVSILSTALKTYSPVKVRPKIGKPERNSKVLF